MLFVCECSKPEIAIHNQVTINAHTLQSLLLTLACPCRILYEDLSLYVLINTGYHIYIATAVILCNVSEQGQQCHVNYICSSQLVCNI